MIVACSIYEFVTSKIIIFVIKKADGGKRINECRSEESVDY